MIFTSGGGGTTSFERLWENASPSSNFTAQSVQIAGLSSYDLLAIETELGFHFISTKSTSMQYMETVKVDEDDLTFRARGLSVTASSNTVRFENCYTCDLIYNNEPFESNDSLIPYVIYGVNKKG